MGRLEESDEQRDIRLKEMLSRSVRMAEYMGNNFLALREGSTKQSSDGFHEKFFNTVAECQAFCDEKNRRIDSEVPLMPFFKHHVYSYHRSWDSQIEVWSKVSHQIRDFVARLALNHVFTEEMRDWLKIVQEYQEAVHANDVEKGFEVVWACFEFLDRYVIEKISLTEDEICKVYELMTGKKLTIGDAVKEVKNVEFMEINQDNLGQFNKRILKFALGYVDKK